ncbi:MAG TPA: 50S ribosomal protein L18 [Candidatus Paceibacterota bacterium]|nr:50S ribosomal protein L18 [Candidatus Paceibacterota bacterium]
MNPRKKLNEKRIRRGARTRAAIEGTAERPRLAVFRSNRHFYAQLIDDMKGVTIVSVSSSAAKTAGAAAKSAAAAAKAKAKAKKADEAFTVGEVLGRKATEKGITKAVFDRGSYKFHGRVKQFAEGAKKAGLTI